MTRPSTIPITTGLICPCCGKPTRRQWDQQSWNPANPPMSQTDCVNPDCAGYYRTLSVEKFFALFGLQSDEKRGTKMKVQINFADYEKWFRQNYPNHSFYFKPDEPSIAETEQPVIIDNHGPCYHIHNGEHQEFGGYVPAEFVTPVPSDNSPSER